MRCKKHPADATSGIGVCASCLRERLFAIIAAQSQAQTLKQAQAHRDLRRPDADPPLPFPRSVSPYISRRKSDTAAACQPQGRRPHRFYSTPLVGPAGPIASGFEKERKSRRGVFSSLFSGLFRSKSDKSGPIHDPGPPIETSWSAPSPSWFPTDLFTGRRKKNARTFSIDEFRCGSRPARTRDRGMSPAGCSGDEDRGGSSGCSPESPQGWRQTPQRTPAQARRGGGKAAAGKGMSSGLKFCLSPLVRASPSRPWSQKGFPPEMSPVGESRIPVKPYLSTATSFCKNRSRKLADFGRHSFDPSH
ncbi:hypothetical protein STAS_32137 [Striga asiatica]|uniref:Uncharacterized protein n=1 Tax=Striga asiatica TaxID=4170 RepID=A0A5A7RAU9_STRAF|nr:hypothetical protein STAS_32137 [Striga asiatica]